VIFKFKPKKITVDCFTPFRGVHELYQIKNASKFFPDDISKMPATYKAQHPQTKIELDNPTIKRCTGVADSYRHGAIIPLWTDLIAQPKRAIKGECAIAMVGEQFDMTIHPHEQFPGILNDYINIKLFSPWFIKEKTGINFVWQSAYWNLTNYERDITFPSVVTSFKYNNQSNIQMFVHKDANDFNIMAGTPMIHLVPMTDAKVEFKCHLVDNNELLKIQTIPSDFSYMFPGRTKRFQREKERQKGCPFGFGK
jgi:hypothetical protein